MKVTFVIIVLFSFRSLFCQDLTCLNYELYNSNLDVVKIKNVLNSEKVISETGIKTKSLFLVVLPNSYVEFPIWTSYRRNGIDIGFKVVLINNSSNDYNLFNIDGQTIIKRQVYFENEWKSIESYNKTQLRYCGSSLFNKKIVIESGDHYTFVTPCFKGNVKVKFRFVISTNLTSEQSYVYSNEFDGFINKKLIE